MFRLIVILIICIAIAIFFYKRRKSPVKLKYADDVTKMNRTIVSHIFTPLNLQDLLDIVDLAKKNGVQIVARGQSHTMGGHSIAPNGYIIDMKYLNHIKKFDKEVGEPGEVVVESGTTWTDLIRYLDPHGHSPMTLQSYSSFSIGGTISVNAHGITNDHPLCESVKSFSIILPDGNLVTVSDGDDLFALVIGGYGLFGIIYEVTLYTVPNKSLKMEVTSCNSKNFHNIYQDILRDKLVNIKIARINLLNMDEITISILREDQSVNSGITSSNLPAQPKQLSRFSQLLYKWMMGTDLSDAVRDSIEKVTGKPIDMRDDVGTRNSFLYESATPLAELYSPLININKTHILQEYFIPKEMFEEFLPSLKSIKRLCRRVTLLNITIRYLYPDKVTFLPYAKKESYAFVLYYRCPNDKKGDEELRIIHDMLTKKALALGGTFYLPYRHHYDSDQLDAAYPEFNEFVQKKWEYDPDGLFMNCWFAKYSSAVGATAATTHFRHILSDLNRKEQFTEFLKNVFNLLPTDQLMLNLENLYLCDDLTIYRRLQQSLAESSTLDKLRLLLNQRETIVKQLKDHLKGSPTIDGYLAIGDPGIYLKSIRRNLNINNPIYIMCEKKDRSQLRQLSLIPQGRYVPMYHNIHSESVDLVTCFIGLHHFTDVNRVTRMAYNVLRPGGKFIIREHDATPDLVPIVDAAHTIFNIVTKVDYKVNLAEYRDFKTVDAWNKIVESAGFTCTKYYTSQEGDPTENRMICYIKVKIDSVPKGVTTRHMRPLSRTFMTLPEWLSVDMAQELSSSLDHTPWFNYPYLANIRLYWKVFYNQCLVVYYRCGFRELLSEYTLMNIVVGIILTLIFLQLSAMAVIPRLIYGSDSEEKIHCIVKNYKQCDDRIKVVRKCGDFTEIEMPRYKEFKEVLFKLVDNDVKIISIAGQKEIQMKIDGDVNRGFNGINLITQYKIVPTKKESIVSVDINKLNSVVKHFHNKIKHVYDF